MNTASEPSAVGGLEWLVHSLLGRGRGGYLLQALDIDTRLQAPGPQIDRATIAMALNVLLLSDLLERAPTAAAYVAGVAGSGKRLRLDHGALRTICGPCGALPRGDDAFARILRPLGFEVGGTYPLAKLRMTGWAFLHRDLPEAVPQFFVSELHVSELHEEAQEAVERVFGSSVDPLSEIEVEFLMRLAEHGSCTLDDALEALPRLAAAFRRQHPPPMLSDYETLRVHSAEAAWIATEGNAFNHAADRVPDVVGLAGELKAAGLPMKAEVEVSTTGRVLQTAFLADPIRREFRTADGSVVRRKVPGSFFEFITRHRDPVTGKVDLSFDSGNATGIFAMTVPP